MKQLIDIQIEIVTNDRNCGELCPMLTRDYYDECNIFKVVLTTENGRPIRCKKCLKCTGEE